MVTPADGPLFGNAHEGRQDGDVKVLTPFSRDSQCVVLGTDVLFSGFDALAHDPLN